MNNSPYGIFVMSSYDARHPFFNKTSNIKKNITLNIWIKKNLLH